MLSKIVTAEEAINVFKDNQTIMFGDWHGEFAADDIIEGLLKKGIKGIEAIAVTGGKPDLGVGKLIVNHQVRKLITTHIALNPQAKNQMLTGDLEVEFVPQGTFAERIRCGGYGLGACLTQTGLGTEIAEGKDTIIIQGKEYLIELPLHADITLIKANRADRLGNISFNGNSGVISDNMAYAGDIVIVEVEELVEVGELSATEIDVPAPIIDMVYVRESKEKHLCPRWVEAIAKFKGEN